ncbi:MAG: hypothetical protein CVU89_17485 [Firmicutes bacterium HGW-Firmicutes-14]|nr:MAG: hypothetical protein CVU89_17485 [Firmicutes bacterium HGW-Firmicutes-14]
MKVKHLIIIITAIFVLLTVLWYVRTKGEALWTENMLEKSTGKTVIYGMLNDPFKNPVGVAVDGHGRIYVVDSDNHRICVSDSYLKPVRQFGSIGSEPGEFAYPVSAAVNSSGEVFVSEISNNRVQVISEQGVFIRWFPHNETDLKGPSVLYIDKDDMVYVFDRGDQQVKLFDREGRLVRSFGGGSGPEEQLRFAMGISVFPDGRLVVSDSGNRSVKIFDKDGQLKELLLENTGGMPDLGLPRGLAVINNDKFALVDSFSRKTYLIWRSGRGWKNKALEHDFVLPDGASYSNGKLYVADRGNSSIVVFDNIR